MVGRDASSVFVKETSFTTLPGPRETWGVTTGDGNTEVSTDDPSVHDLGRSGRVGRTTLYGGGIFSVSHLDNRVSPSLRGRRRVRG